MQYFRISNIELGLIIANKIKTNKMKYIIIIALFLASCSTTEKIMNTAYCIETPVERYSILKGWSVRNEHIHDECLIHKMYMDGVKGIKKENEL
jgi:hypothetical protein